VDAVGDDARLRAGQRDGFRAETVQRHRQQRNGPPVESNMSISRSFGSGWTSFASLISESVTPLIAETTATTLLPACCVANTRRATFLIRSGLPTDVPPYFCTISAMCSCQAQPIAAYIPIAFKISSALASQVVGEGTLDIAVSGSFSPCPVSVTTTVEPGGKNPFGTYRRSPAMPAAEAGSTKTPFFRGKEFVRGQNLRVAHHVDQAAGFVASRFRLLPARRIADADGGGDGLGIGHGLATHDGCGAGGLKAAHLRGGLGDLGAW
jgi:hypothetical protein